MKTIGLIGGMSWESTRIYYELINRDVQQRLGGIHSARMLIASLDMQHIADLQNQSRWEEAGTLLSNEALHLQNAGANIIAIAANTMHKCAPQVMAAITVPFLHIADALIVQLRAGNCTRPLLLATRFTMEDSFYRDKLKASGIDAMIPSSAHRVAMHGIIYNELCKGIVTDASRKLVAQMVDEAKNTGADGVVLGCTEVCMVLDERTSVLPVYDTAAIHARALVDFSLT